MPPMSIWQAPGGDATHTRMPNSAEHPDFSWWSQPTSVRVGLDLRARFAVIRRRMFVFVGALLMALSIGAFVSIKSTRMYRATATIYIDVNVPEVLSGVRDVYDMGVGYWASREYYETQYSIIRSHQVCDKAAALLGLFPQAMLQELARVPPPSVEAQVAGEPLFDLPRPLQEKLRMLGLGHVHRRDSLVQALQNMDPALFIQSRISVAPVRNSRLVQIMGEDSDPDQAMAYANAAADAYIALNLDQKLDVTQAAVGWLHNQVVDLKAKVESSELALHDFRKRNNMVSLSIEDHQNIISQTLAQLNQSLSAARAQGFGLHSQGKQIAATLARGHMPDFLSEEATSSFIQKLRSTYFDLQQQEAELRVAYTAEHPKVQVLSDRTHRAGAALRDELQRVAMKIAKQYEQSLDTQAQLEREINLTKALALELNKKEIDYSRLKRERDTNLALYEVVVKREKEATLTQMLKVNNVRRLDMGASAAASHSTRCAHDHGGVTADWVIGQHQPGLFGRPARYRRQKPRPNRAAHSRAFFWYRTANYHGAGGGYRHRPIRLGKPALGRRRMLARRAHECHVCVPRQAVQTSAHQQPRTARRQEHHGH